MGAKAYKCSVCAWVKFSLAKKDKRAGAGGPQSSDDPESAESFKTPFLADWHIFGVLKAINYPFDFSAKPL